MDGIKVKDYCVPTQLSGEELEKAIQKDIEESKELKEWPKVD